MPAVAHGPSALTSKIAQQFKAMSTELRSEIAAEDISAQEFDRLASSNDASHYLLVPGGIIRPRSSQALARIFAVAQKHRLPLTFRSGGTSLSGQASTDGIMVDTRRHFKKIEVLDQGRRVRVQPGATVMMVNNYLAPYGYRLGPDPASWSACTIGGVVANNSSGMSSGTEYNTYNTLESMVFVLPSGTVIDTADPDADAQLYGAEPDIYAGLLRLRRQLLSKKVLREKVEQQFSMKNTMGYGLNSFLDFGEPVKILEHLLIGSEGTLAFIASATYRTLPILPAVSTGLMVFKDLISATEAIPALLASRVATAELLDATSLRVAQRTGLTTPSLAGLALEQHAALLVEFQGQSQEEVAELAGAAAPVFKSFDLALPLAMTDKAAERSKLWSARRGLYTAVAGNRPSGTNALLEDVVVPTDLLGQTCRDLTKLFAEHDYRDSVIFGHAKDGNIHFMLNEDFRDAAQLRRYQAFTEDMVQLILDKQGSLKAEHGTGRIMAPFVRRQYGSELYTMMVEVKKLLDPQGLLNPGVLLNEDPASLVQNLKVAESVEPEVDRCVECGYCEPVCPSQDLTLTPRQRIVLRRHIKAAQSSGHTELAERLKADYDYAGIDTCAVDGMCLTRCPVHINTADLVRSLRSQQTKPLASAGWKGAAQSWALFNKAAGLALTTAKALPPALPVAATRAVRALGGEENFPLYKPELPAAGPARVGKPATRAELVFFPACVNSMFSGVKANGDPDPMNASTAFMALCERAGFTYRIPEGIAGFCCGTPWKSKGFRDGYQLLAKRVLPALWQASEGGKLPIVCDASSCTEGLQVLRKALTTTQDAPEKAGTEQADYSQLRLVDSLEFLAEQLLPRLHIKEQLESLVLHPTCSLVHLGLLDRLEEVGRALAKELVVPRQWGCCGYAGDRGLLHPELTAAATRAEAAELKQATYSAYASTNRTCEQGMTEATGHTYQNIVQLLERASRP